MINKRKRKKIKKSHFLRLELSRDDQRVREKCEWSVCLKGMNIYESHVRDVGFNAAFVIYLTII